MSSLTDQQQHQHQQRQQQHNLHLHPHQQQQQQQQPQPATMRARVSGDMPHRGDGGVSGADDLDAKLAMLDEKLGSLNGDSASASTESSNSGSGSNSNSSDNSSSTVIQRKRTLGAISDEVECMNNQLVSDMSDMSNRNGTEPSINGNKRIHLQNDNHTLVQHQHQPQPQSQLQNQSNSQPQPQQQQQHQSQNQHGSFSGVRRVLGASSSSSYPSAMPLAISSRVNEEAVMLSDSEDEDGDMQCESMLVSPPLMNNGINGSNNHERLWQPATPATLARPATLPSSTSLSSHPISSPNGLQHHNQQPQQQPQQQQQYHSQPAVDRRCSHHAAQAARSQSRPSIRSVSASTSTAASGQAATRPKSQPDQSLFTDASISEEDRPRSQTLRFPSDMYTPAWIRYSGQQREGFCDTCHPGKWLQLKNSAYWYHKQFTHGISSVSGQYFVSPLEERPMRSPEGHELDALEGLCHQCNNWVQTCSQKHRNKVLWFRHAHKCHIYNKTKRYAGGSTTATATATAATATATAAASASNLKSPPMTASQTRESAQQSSSAAGGSLIMSPPMRMPMEPSRSHMIGPQAPASAPLTAIRSDRFDQAMPSPHPYNHFNLPHPSSGPLHSVGYHNRQQHATQAQYSFQAQPQHIPGSAQYGHSASSAAPLQDGMEYAHDVDGGDDTASGGSDSHLNVEIEEDNGRIPRLIDFLSQKKLEYKAAKAAAKAAMRAANGGSLPSRRSSSRQEGDSNTARERRRSPKSSDPTVRMAAMYPPNTLVSRPQHHHQQPQQPQQSPYSNVNPQASPVTVPNGTPSVMQMPHRMPSQQYNDSPQYQFASPPTLMQSPNTYSPHPHPHPHPTPSFDQPSNSPMVNTPMQQQQQQQSHYNQQYSPQPLTNATAAPYSHMFSPQMTPMPTPQYNNSSNGHAVTYSAGYQSNSSSSAAAAAAAAVKPVFPSPSTMMYSPPQSSQFGPVAPVPSNHIAQTPSSTFQSMPIPQPPPQFTQLAQSTQHQHPTHQQPQPQQSQRSQPFLPPPVRHPARHPQSTDIHQSFMPSQS